MGAGRAAYVSGHPNAGTTAEMAAAAAGYIAYSGPFMVDETTQTLKHTMAVSLFPNWVGDTQARISKLEGDSLTCLQANPCLGAASSPRRSSSGGARVAITDPVVSSTGLLA
jgi:hypothetical protein